MFNILKLFFVFTALIFSQSSHFSETKYYDALGKTFTKQGEITFDGHGKMRIAYANNQGIVTYTGDFLYIEKKGKVRKIDLSEKPAMKIFFVLFEAIYLNKDQHIQPYFEKNIVKGITVLTPKGKSNKYLSTVRYKTVKKRMKFLEIYLTNKDWMRIETLD